MTLLVEQYPRLLKRCREIVGNEDAARLLCLLVIQTAPNKGHGGIITDGEMLSLPPHIRAMKLYKLMGTH